MIIKKRRVAKASVGEEMLLFFGPCKLLRCWLEDGSQVVVTCWNPAVIWVWPEPYLRCALGWKGFKGERVCVLLKMCVELAAGFVKRVYF